MSDKSKIVEFVRNKIEISESEIEPLSKAFVEKKLRKKQLIVQPDFTTHHRYFVTQGALRSFIIDNSGQEVTVALAIEDWWITDYNSYIFQQPATLFVEALMPSTVLQLSYDSQQKLMASNTKFESFFRIIAENGLAAQQRRLIVNLTQSAEERYDSFFKRYPQFINLIPQYIIASYLGMSTEFLSKIRNKKVKKS